MGNATSIVVWVIYDADREALAEDEPVFETRKLAWDRAGVLNALDVQQGGVPGRYIVDTLRFVQVSDA